MTTSKMPKLVHLMVCDDIRVEASGKMMFIGVYNDEVINVPVVPMALLQLNIYSKWDTTLERIRRFEITIKSPNDSTVAHLVGGEDTLIDPAGMAKKYAVIHIGMAPFNIEATGEYKMNVKINDHEQFEMGAIKVALVQVQ